MSVHEHILYEVQKEREAQYGVKGWTPEHDDTHTRGEIAKAAACYVLQGVSEFDMVGRFWPWDYRWWKPRTHRRNLVKAAALLVAEIERIDRAEAAARITPHG